MAIDVRCNVFCNLGHLISGELSDNHLRDNGLIRTTGTLQIDGITLPFRGQTVELAYERTQTGTITRFPRRLRVIKAFADPYRRRSTIEIGCKLALMESGDGRPDQFVADQNPDQDWTALEPEGRNEVPTPIAAQDLLLYCIRKMNIELASGSEVLTFKFLRDRIDLSSGYVSVVSDLLKSHCLYGYMNMEEKLVIRKTDLEIAGVGPVLLQEDFIDIQQIATAEDAADQVRVNFTAVG